LNKEFARYNVMPRSVIIVVCNRYLPLPETRGATPREPGSLREKKMYKTKKTILTIAGSALIALSTIQFAAAASEHQGRAHHRAYATAQFRHSNAFVEPAYVPQWSGYSYGGGMSAPAGH
jgi:hypothetical protein